MIVVGIALAATVIAAGNAPSRPAAPTPNAMVGDDVPGPEPRDEVVEHDFLLDEPGFASIIVPRGTFVRSLSARIVPPDAVEACAGVTAQIVLGAPDGSSYEVGSNVFSSSVRATCGEYRIARPAPGNWTITFQGHGLAIGRVRLSV